MKVEDIEKVLQILDFALKHPISNQFRTGAKNEEDYSLDKLREKIADNSFSTPKEALDKIYATIDLNAEEETFLTLLGDEVKRLLKKKTEILFSSPKDWGLKITKFRSKLADLTAKPPLSVKTLCQWPTRSYIEKPRIEFDNSNDLKYYAELLNKFLKGDDAKEHLINIKRIIDTNEPDKERKEEINIAELNHSTVIALKEYLYSYNQL